MVEIITKVNLAATNVLMSLAPDHQLLQIDPESYVNGASSIPSFM